MNKELLFNTIKALNVDKIETAALLNKYYRANGLNLFKAAEEAEKNISSFIEFCNAQIQYSSDYGTVSLIAEKTNNYVTLLNRSYFFVQELKYHLLNSISNQKFEVLCSKVVEHYLNAESTGVTQKSGDGGI